ncbi:hypothetical protein PMZ80_004417 [Knufia obscura]|uniref:Uncharacterized protein n=2 Tax=Knufia TaxID=430999 RepID=A0AAN8EQB1_9EURO|nr:hypothetical protein PMZ80_004417 [Knufia obscura]KAK5951706.1 hypothetical protein OHC33_007385 [Knufia fluminis]
MALKPSGTFKEAHCKLSDVFLSDSRPTIIIDVSDTKYARGVQLEFANDAFTDQYGVLLRFIISGQILEPDFIDWLNSPAPKSTEYLLGDLSWTFFILEKRYKVVNVAAARTGGERSRACVPSHITSATEVQSSRAVPVSTTPTSSTDSSNKQKVGDTLTVALPSGLVSLGSAPTALDGLHRSVDMLDVGFFEYDLEGTLIFANKSWYALSGHPMTPQAHTEMRFLDLCHPDDAGIIGNAWSRLFTGEPTTFEMRWKHMGSKTAKALGAQWVLSACLPLYDDQGNLKSISGCTTDINTQKLNEQIAHARAEALERARTFEERFIRFATVAPIVIFSLDSNKKMTYCNDRWFEVTTTKKKPFEDINIGEGFLEDDVAKLYVLVNQAIANKEVNTVEMRARRVWHASDGRSAQFWVLASIFAEFTNEGIFQGCTGTLTDISEFKYAETLQRIRLEDALEAKRQQENFIDMTSHEMRNPLSAMVQCADSALAAINEIQALVQARATEHLPAPLRDRLLEEVGIGSEGLQTIISCCAHQKCIIDDVLTLSKLDSHLLAITPVKVEPVRVMQDVSKMFEKDAQKAGIEFTTMVDDFNKDLDVHWLMMDPSRVKQILINLISNAIKFTRNEATRTVVLTMWASLEAPASNGDVQYAPASRSVPDDFLTENDWGSGEIVYLQFSLQDTGRGLSVKEQEKLFHRFSQASPKTHVEYGGSGLGLFITRQLTELQGGEIGVASEAGKGSTFAFYIQTRRTAAPEAPLSPPSSPARTSPRTSPMKSLNAGLSAEGHDKVNLRSTGANISIPSKTNQVDLQLSVLVVEDNMVNQKVLSTQLKRLGCTVFVAGHGLEALNFLKTTQLWHGDAASTVDGTDRIHSTCESSVKTVDVILMDIEMPVMGGLECTRAIRELEARGSIRRPQLQQSCYPGRQHDRLPIISISANARAEQSNEQKEAGVDDIVTKPFRIPQLMDKIWGLMGREASDAAHG